MSKLKIFDTWELYTSKESLEHVQYKFKKKKYDFLKKKFFFWNFWFFSKGGTLWCRNRQKFFFPFFKNFGNKPQKWLSWDHSNINRNKVMNFGGRSSYPADTVRPFTVIRAIMPPPRIGLIISRILYGCSDFLKEFPNMPWGHSFKTSTIPLLKWTLFVN